ncbi:hypothetical protein S40288_02447 [Stachybotrys chartarum IBT 40288]|nr:hypothetical protein S40288_02447 [Stachybotrys chartarum IBT 40288]
MGETPNKRSFRKWASLNVTVTSPSTDRFLQHDDEVISGAKMRDQAPVTPEILFPNLQETMTHLLNGLEQEQYQDLEFLDFPTWIKNNGGVTSVTNTLLAAVDRRVMALCNQKLSPRLWVLISKMYGLTYLLYRLNDILASQSEDEEPWPDSAGYADYTFKTRQRIPYHITRILAGSQETLHYYILSCGGGYRRAHIIRLWSLEPTSPTTAGSAPGRIRNHFQDVLEMVFCRAFQTLAAATLEQYWGPAPAGVKYANVGLNVLPPLLQSVHLGEPERRSFVIRLHTSPDPEVRRWISVRGKLTLQWNAVLSIARDSIRSPLYIDALRNALDRGNITMHIDNLAESRTVPGGTIATIQDIFESFERQWAAVTGKNATFTRPFGSSLRSRVGFVLSYGDVRIDGAESAIENPIRLPWGFVEQGFTEENSVIWTSHLRQYSGLTVQDVGTASNEGRQMLVDSNRKLIRMSSLRVIFLCGLLALDIILSGLRNHQRCELQLGKFTYEMIVEPSAGSSRLYIVCPELPVRNSTLPWPLARRLDIIIKFAAFITKTEGIISGIFESTSSLARILRQAQAEARGGTVWTAESLDINTRAWLIRKGFTEDDDIARLQQAAGGSLTRGISMLLHALPRRPYKISVKTAPESSYKPLRDKRHNVAFEKSHYQQVEALTNEVRRKSRVLFETELLDLDHDITVCREVNNARDKSCDKEVGTEDPALSLGTKILILDFQMPLCGESNENEEPDDEGDIEVEQSASFSNKMLELDDEMPVISEEDVIEEIDGGQQEIEVEQCRSIPKDEVAGTNSLGRSSEQQKGTTQNIWEPGQIAKSTWESRHRLEGYRVRAPTKVHAGGPLVNLGYIELYFPRDMEFGERYITIHPEFSAQGIRHPEVYATRALGTDPASRLAIRSTGILKDGTPFDIFLYRNAESAVLRANAFADRVLDGKNRAEIQVLPRRWVPAYRDRRHVIGTPAGLRSSSSHEEISD